MKNIYKILLLVIILLLVTSCKAINSNDHEVIEVIDKSEERIVLELYTYYADTDVDVVDYAVNVIESKYPVQIEIMHRSDATGIEIKTMAAVGKLPDIYEVTGETVINTFIKSGDILALESYMEQENIIEKVNKTTVNSLIHKDGHTYALNIEAPRNYLIYYNQEVFNRLDLELPTNFDEMVEVTKVFTANDIIPFALFGAEPWPGVQLYDAIASRYNNGGIKSLVNGENSITDEGYIKAAEQVRELVNAGFIGDSAFSTNASQAFEQFRSGQAAMIGNGTWYLLDLANYGEGYGYLDNPFAVPGHEDETMFIRSGGSSEGGWAVNAKGDNVELATQIAIEYSLQRAIASVKIFGSPNPLTYHIESDVKRHDAIQKYSDEIKLIESTTFFPWNISNPRIANALNDNNQKLLSGEISVELFISNLNKVIELNVDK